MAILLTELRTPSPYLCDIIYSRRLLRCRTARGYGSKLSLGGPTKVKPRKSFLFTEGSIKDDKEHLIDFVVTLKYGTLSIYDRPLR